MRRYRQFVDMIGGSPNAQLNLFYSGPLWKEPVVGMLYGVEGLLRSDLLFQFPLAFTSP